MSDSEPSKMLILMTEQALLYLNVVIEKSFQLISNNVCLKIDQSKSQHKKGRRNSINFFKKLMLSLKELTLMIIMCF